jgi:hybrid cluster-associated redox disulfide protein
MVMDGIVTCKIGDFWYNWTRRMSLGGRCSLNSFVFDHIKESSMETIQKEMAIGEVVEKYPQTVEVFLRHGLMCFGCAVARFENVEQGAIAHGIDVKALMKDLNAAVHPVSS